MDAEKRKIHLEEFNKALVKNSLYDVINTLGYQDLIKLNAAAKLIKKKEESQQHK